MYSDLQWLEQTATRDNSDSRWYQDNYLDDEYGLCISPWSLTTGNNIYDTNTHSNSSTGWTPNANGQDDLELDNLRTDSDGFLSDAFIEQELLQPVTTSLQWDGAMTATAHEEFFGLDLGVGFGPSSSTTVSETCDGLHNATRCSPVAFDQSQVESKLMVDVAAVQKSPVAPDKIQFPHAAKIQKTFHFVANSDKKTATRLRNTMTSRNLRQSKVSRIAQLEKELEEQKEEMELWKQRAIERGWKDS